MVSKTYRCLNIRPETKDRFEIEIKEEFLRHHPEFKDFNLSHDFLLNKIIDYYLEI